MIVPSANLYPDKPVVNRISIAVENFINLSSDTNLVPFGNEIAPSPKSASDSPLKSPPSVSPLIVSETSSSQFMKFLISVSSVFCINDFIRSVFLLSGKSLNILIKRSLPNVSLDLPAFLISFAPNGSTVSISGLDSPVSFSTLSSEFSVDVR